MKNVGSIGTHSLPGAGSAGAARRGQRLRRPEPVGNQPGRHQHEKFLVPGLSDRTRPNQHPAAIRPVLLRDRLRLQLLQVHWPGHPLYLPR